MAARTTLLGLFECEAAFASAFYDDHGNQSRLFTLDEVRKVFTDRGMAPPAGLSGSIVPVGLRWRLSQHVGLPVTPFTLWRKFKKTSLASIPAVLAFSSSGQKTFFTNGPFIRLSITIKNNNTVVTTVTVKTLNALYDERNGKSFNVTLAASGTNNLSVDFPNVKGVRIIGSAKVQAASGITMDKYVQDPDWQKIQIVGLPFKSGDVSPDLYGADKQGFINSLTDPEKACVQRTDIYSVFTKKSPPLAPDGVAIPTFNTPAGAELVSAYNNIVTFNNGKSGVLLDIKDMYNAVYKTNSSLLLGKQENFIKNIQTLGAVDPANPNPRKDGLFENPVCSATLLSAAADCWHALGLGFGTIDFLPVTGNPTAVVVANKIELNSFDYMVTATFRMPVIEQQFQFPGIIKERWTGFTEFEYAAICHVDIQLPPAPLQLEASAVSQNRPLKRDDFYYDQVRISWAKTVLQEKSPLSFAIAFKNNVQGTPIQYLNSKRPNIPGKPQPFLPANRIADNAADPPGRDGSEFIRFFHDRSPVPFIGSVAEKYYVAAQNVFGLWSGWAIATDTLIARPPQIPHIISAVLNSQTAALSNHIYPATFEIVLNYNWQDRTPFEIQLAGYFLTTPNANPPVVTNGITMSNAGGNIEKYFIRFTGLTPKLFKLNSANLPVAVNATEGDVVADPAHSTGSSKGEPTLANPEMFTYRVRLKAMSLNFSAASKLRFAIYTRASEVRNPANISAYSKPLPITTADPAPRVPPAFLPDIRWASLPDAAGTSRFHLSFTPVPGAVGYAVYMATEMSLQDRLKTIGTYPATGSIFERRTTLNNATTDDKKAALDAFTRVSKKMLISNEAELEMNGDTQGLFIYAVSSFTEQNVESKLSDWIYVAVPERIVPAPPLIAGSVSKDPANPKATIKLNSGAGNNSDKFEIFRTTKSLISTDANMMGLPTSSGPAGWLKFKTINGVDTPVTDPAAPFDYFQFEETLAAGWSPYYYRAIGVGTNQPVNGKIPGRSASSNLLSLLPPVPADGPLVTNATIVGNADQSKMTISFKTNAYVGKSPHGSHTVFIYKQNPSGLWDLVAGDIIPNIPKLIAGQTEPLDKLVRLNTESGGFTNYALTKVAEEKATFRIEVRDPLGRINSDPHMITIVTFIRPTISVSISNLAIKRIPGRDIVAFKTNIGKTRPPSGQFTLTISVQRGHLIKALLSIAMHKIPDQASPILTTASISGGTSKDALNLFSYAAVFTGVANFNALATPAILIVSITNPRGSVTEKRLNI